MSINEPSDNRCCVASQTLTASLIQPAGALGPNGATAGLPSAAFLSANSIMKVLCQNLAMRSYRVDCSRCPHLCTLYPLRAGDHAVTVNLLLTVVFSALQLWGEYICSGCAPFSLSVLFRDNACHSLISTLG